MNVLIVDDHPLVREGLERVLHSAYPSATVSHADSLARALSSLAAFVPDMVFLDYPLPDCSGLNAIAALRRHLPTSSAIVILADEEDASLAHLLVSAGAQGFISKRSPCKLVLAAIEIVRCGGTYLPANLLRRLELHHESALLTPRQRDVLRLLAGGTPNRDIACELGIAESTIRAHVSAILRNLGVDNRTQAAKEAMRRGLVSPV